MNSKACEGWGTQEPEQKRVISLRQLLDATVGPAIHNFQQMSKMSLMVCSALSEGNTAFCNQTPIAFASAVHIFINSDEEGMFRL